MAQDGGFGVAVLCDRPGATQHISFTLPLAAPVGRGEARLHIFTDKSVRGGTAAERLLDRLSPDVLVLSRYTNGAAQPLLDAAAARGIPLVFHVDDDLLAPPLSLGPEKYAHYADPARIAALRAAMDASRIVYASTPVLAEVLRGHGVAAPVVAGEIYCAVDPQVVPDPLPATGPVVGYMGTGGHGQDLEMVLPAVARLMRAIPGMQFETFGTIARPEALAGEFGRRVRHHEPTGDYDAFLRRLQGLGWWVGLAPLEDSGFNRCKADTKWVEYTSAGIAVVASDGPVYRRACADGCGIMADSPEAWEAGIRLLLLDRAAREGQLARARARLLDAYARPRLTEQLLGILAAAREGGAARAAGR